VNKRTKFLLGIGVIAALVLGFQIVAYATVSTDEGFEAADGNLAPNGTTPNFDWNSFATTTWTGTAPNRQSTKNVSGFQFLGIEDAQAANTDSAFAGGTKQDDNCATLAGAKAPNKDDLKRVYLSSKVVGGQTFLNLAWVRIPQNTTSASAHVGFEFNKGTTPCVANQPNGLVQRTLGDMLVVYDFEGGTNAPVITVRRWVTSGACDVGSSTAPCWGPAQNLTAGGFAEAKVNVGQSVSDTISPSSPTSATLNDSEFGEAGINLTAAGIIPANSCEGFGKVFAVSRSSGNSGTAAMKDIVGPANFNLNNCGTVNIIKQTSPAGLDKDFSFTSASSVLGGTCTMGNTPETTPASFTLNDKADATDSLTCTSVPAGTYTVTEGANPDGFAFSDLSCTASGTGTSATPTGPQSATRTASITIAAGGTATCTYTNNQELGAIQVTKQSSKTGHLLSGAEFSVTGPNGFSTTLTTSDTGTACVDGLAFGDYTVTETAAPDGFVIDDPAGQPVTVNNNAACDDSPYGGETQTFTDSPTSDIQVNFKDGGSGETSLVSDITCDNTTGEAPDTTPATGWDASTTITGIEAPATIHCTIDIDP